MILDVPCLANARAGHLQVPILRRWTAALGSNTSSIVSVDSQSKAAKHVDASVHAMLEMLEPADCGRFRGDVWDGEVCWQYRWSQCTERCWDFEQNPESGWAAWARAWWKRNADGLLSDNRQRSRVAAQPLGGCLVNDQSLESQFQKFLNGKGHIVWPATFLTSRILSKSLKSVRCLSRVGISMKPWMRWMHCMHCTWMDLTSWQSCDRCAGGQGFLGQELCRCLW